VEMGPRTNQMGPRRVEGENDLRRWETTVSVKKFQAFDYDGRLGIRRKTILSQLLAVFFISLVILKVIRLHSIAL
jgi:hypothetical protein